MCSCLLPNSNGRSPPSASGDKIAASKRKGLWVGGPLPLGYAMKDGKIAVVEDEAERVRLVYRRYLELGGVNALVRDLRDKDIRTKTRLRATGATHGGIPFERGSLFYLLRNRFYIGEVKYKGEILPGEQPAIMDRAGPGRLNRVSASIGGASAGVRLPCGVAAG